MEDLIESEGSQSPSGSADIEANEGPEDYTDSDDDCCEPVIRIRDFKMPRMENEDSLKEWNDKLGRDTMYMAEILCNLLHMLDAEEDIDRRLTILVEVFFEKEFLSRCSWTGLGIPGPTVRLCVYTHVITLFIYAGGNTQYKLTTNYIKWFFITLYRRKMRCPSKGLHLLVTRKRRHSE